MDSKGSVEIVVKEDDRGFRKGQERRGERQYDV